jgi:probable blue pigment (indigoidine) exporter
MVLGVLNIGAFFALLFGAAYRLPGGVAATLGSIQPLIAAALAVGLLGERLRPRIVVAGMIGVAGVALLVLRAGAALDAVGVVAGLAGAVSMASGIVLAKRWGQPVPVAAFTSWQLIAGALALLPLVVAFEGAPSDLTARNLAGFGWFATTTALAYLLWFRGVAHLPVGKVSLLSLLSPIVATLAGSVFLHQELTRTQLAGAALVLAAIALGQRRSKPTGRSGTPPRRRPRPLTARPQGRIAFVSWHSSHRTRSCCLQCQLPSRNAHSSRRTGAIVIVSDVRRNASATNDPAESAASDAPIVVTVRPGPNGP